MTSNITHYPLRSRRRRVPNCTSAYCDKLKVRLSLDADKQAELLHAVREPHYFGATKRYWPGFRRNLQFYANDNPKRSAFTLQLNPVQGGPGLCLTYNPARVSPEEVRGRINSISPVLYEEILHCGVYQRVDVTVDIRHLNINSVLISKSRARKTCTYYHGGNLETVYYGGFDSDRLFVAYDKQAEIRRKRSEGKTDERVPAHSMTRIEHREKSKMNIYSLVAMSNPFTDVHFYQIPQYRNMSVEQRLFVGYCRSSGCRAALLTMRRNKRDEYSEWLNTFASDWWFPAEVWEAWPSELERLGVEL